VRLRLRGRALVAFVNDCVEAGYALWGLQRTGPAEAVVRMRLDAFARCRPAARRTRTRVHILARGGLPFALRRIARRPVLVAGAAALAVALWVLGARVWIVQVQGGDPRTQAEVLAAAAALGLHAGTPRAAIDPSRLGDELAARVPGVAWAAIRLQGVRADLTVAERVGAGAGEVGGTGPFELVASSDGVVQRVLALRGRALVVPGQTVVRGQVLITGEGEASPRGAVMALVWYHKTTEIALRRAISVPTGRVAVRWRLRLFGWRIGLGGAAPLPFADYQLSTQEWGIRWRNLQLPVALEALRYQQVDRIWRQLTPEEAVAEGTGLALADLQSRLPAGSRPGEPEVSSGPLGGLAVVVSVTLPVEEDIATPRALPAP
jgi:similar to stage IV sporulation protein